MKLGSTQSYWTNNQAYIFGVPYSSLYINYKIVRKVQVEEKLRKLK